MKNNRRDFLKITSIAGLGVVGAGVLPVSAGIPIQGAPLPNDPAAAKALAPMNRFPRMVHDHFVKQLRAIERKGNEVRSGMKTKADAEAYVRDIRSKIQQCLGPWPEKTPLNAKTTGKIERDDYTIENVIFESRPGLLVTANLYIPKKRKFPLPAVLGTCGHSNNGKAEPAYQSFCQGLAKKGYVVLIFDPLGQGERLQYINADLKSIRRVGTEEHLYMGNQLILGESSLSSWFVWDGIRALDYLLSRTEVDPKHIGVTGNSGGGTQTTLLCGVEDRFTMAAPSCYVTTFRRNLENEEVADAEQCPPQVIGKGLDHADFIAAMAPKPVILLSQEKDFFDTRGTAEAFARLKQLYKLLGAEENIQLFVGPDYHGYKLQNREAMYGWFNKFTKISNENTEPAIQLEKDEVLQCTPRGQIKLLGSKTIISFTKELSESLKRKRSRLSVDALQKAVVDSLKLPDFDGAPDYRILRQGPSRLYPTKYAANYAVETEDGMFTLLYRLSEEPLYSRIPLGPKKAVLYVSHRSADDELRTDSLLKDIIAKSQDAAIFACDVRGIGESEPGTTFRGFNTPYGSDYFYAVHSNMLGYPYVGQKTYDLLKVINLLKANGHEEIHLVGKGWGAIPATFAALLSDAVTEVTLKNALTSYSDVAEYEEYNWPLSSFIPGVLTMFDLPDCYAALSTKGLKQLEPWDAAAGKG